MVTLISRRAALLGAAVLFSGSAFADEEKSARFRARISELERRHGGRLGVSLFDTQSGVRFGYRGDEAFPMCSTFKFLLVAAILQRVDANSDQLDRAIPFSGSDIETYAPVTKAHVGAGAMPVSELCAAAMVWSDNTAANLLLRELGGPDALTRFVRSLGDKVTRADRTEPTLNTAIPDDPRDTTHPNAMIGDMSTLLLASVLSPASRGMLLAWMVGAQTGQKRLRAGFPADWRVGDKTGSGDNATANTIAILDPPGRAPILAAVYYTLSNASEAERNNVHADIGRLIPELF